jgi:hypothetical protein
MKLDYMIDHKMNPDAEDEQRCSQCKHTMLMEHFSQNKKGDYFKACEPCREYARLYRSKNKDKKKAYNKVYHDANKDEIQEYRKKYYDSNKKMIAAKKKLYQALNKEKIAAKKKINYNANRENALAKRKIYYDSNRDKVLAANKEYRMKNHDKILAREKKYRAANPEIIAIRNKSYQITNPEKLQAYREANKDRHKCEECGYATSRPSALRKHACGNDGMSSGEREVFRVLNDLRIDFEFGGNTVYLPIKEATGRNLKYDFIVRFEDRLLFIEYDGRQHFKAIPHWGGENSLDEVRERDAIKTEFCEDRGYPLLRIPYTKHGIIPLLVVEFLVEYTNWGYE